MLGRARQQGAASVELALLLMLVLVPILFGVFEVGRAMFYYNTLVKAARDAARIMTIQAPGGAGYAGLKADATCAAWSDLTTKEKDPCTSPLLPGLTSNMVVICDAVNSVACPGKQHAAVETGSGVVNLVTVSIGAANNPYVYTPVVPILPTFNFGPISVTMRQVL